MKTKEEVNKEFALSVPSEQSKVKSELSEDKPC